MRAAVYVRVSSQMQIDNYSLASQKRACREYCDRRGWQVIKTYKDAGESAKTTERSALQHALYDAASNRYDVLVTWKLDRLSRDVKDTLEIIDQLADSGVSYKSATEEFDSSTAAGRMTLQMLAVGAEYQNRVHAERVSAGKEQNARQGGWNGTLAQGYTTPKFLHEQATELLNAYRSDDISENEYRRKQNIIEATLKKYSRADESDAIPDPFQADGVRLAFETYRNGGYSDARVARFLNENGYRVQRGKHSDGLYRKSMVTEMLQNKFYTGLTSYGVRVDGEKRQWIDGNHEAIISQELFDKCQQVRENRGRFRRGRGGHNAKRVYPLRDVLYDLKSGRRLGGRYSHNRRYYRLRNDGTQNGYTVRAKKVEGQVYDLLREVKIPDSWLQLAIEALEKEAQKTGTGDKQQQIKAKIARLNHMYLEYGAISEDEYSQQLADLKSQLRQVQPPQKIKIPELHEMAELMQDAGKIWGAISLEERSSMSKKLFHRLYVKDKAIQAVQPTPVLWYLLNGGQSGEDRIRTCEPV